MIEKAQKYGIPSDLFLRQIGRESQFNPKARSRSGAGGIAQIMPATAKAWGVNAYKPDEALDAAAKNMREYFDKYGSWKNALLAYSAGEPNFKSGNLRQENREYPQRILGQMPLYG